MLTQKEIGEYVKAILSYRDSSKLEKLEEPSAEQLLEYLSTEEGRRQVLDPESQKLNSSLRRRLERILDFLAAPSVPDALPNLEYLPSRQAERERLIVEAFNENLWHARNEDGSSLEDLIATFPSIPEVAFPVAESGEDVSSVLPLQFYALSIIIGRILTCLMDEENCENMVVTRKQFSAAIGPRASKKWPILEETMHETGWPADAATTVLNWIFDIARFRQMFFSGVIVDLWTESSINVRLPRNAEMDDVQKAYEEPCYRWAKGTDLREAVKRSWECLRERGRVEHIHAHCAVPEEILQRVTL